jgi:two-component system LytT family response regulator
MLKAILIEDEIRNVELLKKLVEDYCPDLVQIKGNADNITDALTLIHNVQPDLVYMDIELISGNAFDLLDKLGDFSFRVIFITAYNQYALKAFKYHAVDYLLKPIDIDELINATKNVAKSIESNKSNNHLAEALKMLKMNSNIQKIGIPVADGTSFINAADIISIEAKGSYSVLNLINKKTLTTTKSLKEIEQMLHWDYFIRVHNSWVINLNYIKKYYKGKSGYIEMEDGSTVSVSVRKKGTLLDFLHGGE